MNALSSRNINSTQFRSIPNPAKAELTPQEEAPGESFTFSSGSRTAKQIGKGVGYGALGAVPGVGAYYNLIGVIGSGFANNEANMYVSGAGLVSNVAGTVTLATGLIMGHETATKVGMGLLAGSAVSAGFVYGTGS